jgi:hypothetical protein
MSSPSDLRPTILEELERRASEAAHSASGKDALWEKLLQDLELAQQGSPALQSQPPLLDPDAARQSSAELRQLISALREATGTSQQAPVPTSEETRAGYAIEGSRGTGETHVHPAFAEALARRESPRHLRDRFPDLWAVDAALWRELGASKASPAALAHAWLASPGRRLAQELSALRQAVELKLLGASDFSWKGLCAAAGPLPGEAAWGEPSLSRWRELHAAIPGATFEGWSPSNENDVSGVLRVLEGRRGDPVCLRGAALAWLLNRAATEPLYVLDELQRDLREDLLPALVSAFPGPKDERYGELRAAARLETVTLQHAARLVSGLRTEEALPRAWSLARWIHSCAFRSPFFGGDEEALAARLRALLPEEPAKISVRDDVLDPARIRDDDQGLAIEDLALVAGAIEHYVPKAGAPRPVLLPTPPPLVHALRRVAGRRVRPQEWKAEELLAREEDTGEASAPALVESTAGAGESPMPLARSRRPGNTLGWKGHHVAPPLAARWLMTYRSISWLAAAPDVWEESLQCFEQSPARYRWVASALYSEREALNEPLRNHAANSWRYVRQTQAHALGNHETLPLMAAAVLDRLSAEEERGLVAMTGALAPDVRHYVLEALALAAERYSRPELWREALEALAHMLEDERLETPERLRAALLVLRRVSALPSARPERAAYLRRLTALVASPPFSQSVGLRRELRKLGVALPHDTGGGR